MQNKSLSFSWKPKTTPMNDSFGNCMHIMNIHKKQKTCTYMQLLAQLKGFWNICFFLCFLDIAGGFSPVGVDGFPYQARCFSPSPRTQTLELVRPQHSWMIKLMVMYTDGTLNQPNLHKTSPTLKI